MLTYWPLRTSAAALLILVAFNLLVFALLRLVSGDYLTAIGDVAVGLILLAFVPKRKPRRI
jgi:hypothetical protein